MKNILVPIDHTKLSKCAAEVAAQIARKSGGKVYLLNVVDFPLHDPNYTKEADNDVPVGLFIGKIVKERLEKYAQSSFLKGVAVETILREEENIYETIVEESKENDIDLIVMGTHSRSQLNKYFIGSNTDKVIRLSDVPVLSVKRRHEELNIHNIAFASNFYGESYTVFNSIKPIIELFKPCVHFVKVITPADFEPTPVSRKLIEDFASKFEIDNYTINIYNDYKVESGINRFAKDIDADIISMETHGGNSIYQLITGSVMGDVLENTKLPVLTIKIDEPEIMTKGIFPEMR